MKKLFFAVALATASAGFCQVIELEEGVKKQSKDTLDGWKKAGYFALNAGNNLMFLFATRFTSRLNLFLSLSSFSHLFSSLT